MCLILVAYRVDSRFPLTVAANRDEYFARPTRRAHFWSDYPDIYGGRDLQDGGTWMGVSRTGRFAAVANWSFSNEKDSDYRSRGDLVREFLRANDNSIEFVNTINPSEYRGCNLIVYDGNDLVYWSNHGTTTMSLDPGCHVITNASFNSRTTRASVALKKFELLDKKNDVKALLALLEPKKPPQDSGCFVFGDTYGTRASTTLLLGSSNVSFCEQQYGPNAALGSLASQEIELIPR